MQLRGIQQKSALQCFHEGYVLGNITVLTSNTLGDTDRPRGKAFDYHPDARRSRVAV